MKSHLVRLVFAALVVLVVRSSATDTHLPATAYAIPKHTAPEGEGYFAIIEGKNQRLYIGTHAEATNSWLVEFDPATETMKEVVDAHAAIGTNVTGFGSQSKIHTRNNVGESGKIYFGTKQGYPGKDEKLIAYPGGYPMTYDPATETTHVFPIPVPHHGINSITPDESRGIAYISTCLDQRPYDSTHFMVLELETERYTHLLDAEHVYAFIVVDYKGRAYHPIRGGEIARYDPETKQLTRLKQTIDGKAPEAASRLVDENAHPINWDISPDRKTLYAQPMSGNALYAYDLTAEGDVLPGRTLGRLLNTDAGTDCRAMCVGPSGTVWAAVTTMSATGTRLPKLVRYRPGTDEKPVDMGMITVANPDFTEFTDESGKTLPYHKGFMKLPDGVTIPSYVLLGVCEGADGAVNILALHPYTVLRIPAEKLK